MIEEHRASVADYFAGHPRFLHFKIDCDDISVFLKPSFDINHEYWKLYNATPVAEPAASVVGEGAADH